MKSGDSDVGAAGLQPRALGGAQGQNGGRPARCACAYRRRCWRLSHARRDPRLRRQGAKERVAVLQKWSGRGGGAKVDAGRRKSFMRRWLDRKSLDRLDLDGLILYTKVRIRV